MEILLKSTISIEFLANRPKLYINCALLQNSTPGNQVKLRYFMQRYFSTISELFINRCPLRFQKKDWQNFPKHSSINVSNKIASLEGFRNFSVKNPCWSSFKVHLHSFQGVFQRDLENTLFEKVCVGILLFQNFRSINYSLQLCIKVQVFILNSL